MDSNANLDCRLTIGDTSSVPLLQGIDHFNSAVDSLQSSIIAKKRSPKKSHHFIANIFVDDPAIFVDHLRNLSHTSIKHFNDSVRLHILSQLSKAANICEEDRDNF